MWMGKCYTFKGQNLGNGLSYVFQAMENLHDLSSGNSSKVRAKGIGQYGAGFVLLQNGR